MDRTLEKDTDNYPFIRSVVRELGEKSAQRLRADCVAARTVSLKIRYADFSEVARSVTLKEAADGNAEILDCLDRLLGKTLKRRLTVRQVGVKLSGIEAPLRQMNLFDERLSRRQERDRVVDAIRRRFGFDAIRSLEGK
jgi:DNA polymerase-4